MSVELCTWADFSLTDIERLQMCSSNRDHLKQAIWEKLGLECAEKATTKDSIEVDLYIYLILFGIRQKFSAAQLSTLLTIVKRVHDKCVSTVFDNQSEVTTYFQELMVQHSVNRPPFSVGVFTPNEVKNVNEYILSTYFKHFKLYKYAFTRKVHLNLSLSYAGEEVQVEVVDGEDKRALESSTDKQEEGEGVGVPTSEEQSELVAESPNSHLKEVITSGLNKIIQQEQERFHTELAVQESRLLSRIATLEATLDTKRPRTNSAKKKTGKTPH